MKRAILSIIFALHIGAGAIADEGMWLPMLVERLNYTDMQKEGLQLTPEELYSINNSSLKDAIVNLGGGFCTGEIISDQGLMLTNHHCAYSFIQKHSSVGNDYLTNGFWAMNKEEELPNEGLFVQFLVSMEDVTPQVLSSVEGNMSEMERGNTINAAIDSLQKAAKGDTHYDIT
jgi:hypothetical protein